MERGPPSPVVLILVGKQFLFVLAHTGSGFVSSVFIIFHSFPKT